MRIKIGLVCYLVICICVTNPGLAVLKTIDEVSDAIVHRLPSAQIRFTDPEKSVLRFAIDGERDRLEIPWAHPSYDHRRTTIFLEELATFYKDPEAAPLRPRFSRLLYTEQQTPFCEYCIKALLKSHFQTLFPQGEEGLYLFWGLFQVQSTMALPLTVNSFLLEDLEIMTGQRSFPKSIQELDFTAGIYSTLSPEGQSRVEEAIEPDVLIKLLLLLDRHEGHEAIPYPLPPFTTEFLRKILDEKRLCRILSIPRRFGDRNPNNESGHHDRTAGRHDKTVEPDPRSFPEERE